MGVDLQRGPHGPPLRLEGPRERLWEKREMHTFEERLGYEVGPLLSDVFGVVFYTDSCAKYNSS